MYVEISGRGSGKTERMSAAISQWLRSDSKNIAIVYTLNHRAFGFIRKKVLEKYSGARNIDSRLLYQDEFGEKLRGIKLNELNKKHFFEEFDHPLYKFLNLKILKNGYYVTTPIKRRSLKDKNDFLIDLIKANNYKYDTYISTTCKHLEFADPITLSKEVEMLRVSLDFFKLQFLSQFLNDY